jgi:hypothetical protein
LIYVRGAQRVWAWDQPEPFRLEWFDVAVYSKLLIRAAADVFQPFGISEEDLRLRMEGNAAVIPLPFMTGKQIRRLPPEADLPN